jgi:pyruvate dehydrogenase E1 component beta subunit
MVIRLIIGRGWGQGPQHSQSLEPVFAHVPGLKVIAPATPVDAKAMMLAAIADNNPVLVLEHRWLHGNFGGVPEEPEQADIGIAKVLRSGSDATIVTYSYGTIEALRCASILAEHGFDLEVVDLRTLRPLDMATVIESVGKTRRLITLDGGWKFLSVGAEVVAGVFESGAVHLESPPVRLGMRDVPLASTRSLANLAYVQGSDLLNAVAQVTGRDIDPAIAEQLPPVTDVPDRDFNGPF